jgi:hypothetical protein
MVFANWRQKWIKLPLLDAPIHWYTISLVFPYILHINSWGGGFVPTPLHHRGTLQSLDHGELKDFHSMSNCLKSKYYLILWLLARVIFYHSALYSYWMMLGHFNKKACFSFYHRSHFPILLSQCLLLLFSSWGLSLQLKQSVQLRHVDAKAREMVSTFTPTTTTYQIHYCFWSW